MVLKPRSDSPTKLIKNKSGFSAWSVPELDAGKAPSFRQPVEESQEPELTQEEETKLAEAELKAIRDAAFQEGFESGKEAGLAAAQQQIDELTQTLKSLIQQLNDPLAQCAENTQKEILQLAFAIARQIVRRELQQDPTQLIAIIRASLKLLPIGSQNITILLHPEDAAVVKNALSIGSDNESGDWKLRDDPSVERGSCQINTENSKIDASIDKQIAVLFSRVAGGQRAGEADAD